MIARLVSAVLKRSLKPFVFEASSKREANASVRGLGLYVHIPFCRSLCAFCPYFKVTYEPALVAPFVEAIKAEIRNSARGGPREICSVYFGGGTPALLLRYLPEIQQAIDRSFHVEGPRGIELHPDDITSETAIALRAAGFDMVSLGMQSFQPECLSSLGRKPEDLSDRISLARDHGFDVVDVDLIFGIPGQTGADIQADFRTAVSRGATQVSTYPFIDFSYANNPRKPLGRRRKRELLEAILEASEDLGFERTSVWTFARKGSGRYSSVTRDNYLGFGPSAASLLRSSFSINVFSVQEYIRVVGEGRHPTAFTAELSHRERALFWLFWHSYNLRIERSEFQNLLGADLESEFGLELRAAQHMGILRPSAEGYNLTRRGAYLFHLVEQLYTSQYIDRVWHLATTTPWPDRLVIW